MKVTAALLVTLALLVALGSAKVYFHETFDDGWEGRWVESNHKKSEGTAGAFKINAGKHFLDEAADAGLQTAEDARFYQISAVFDEFNTEGKDLVIQYSLKHEQNVGCGGSYLKVGKADIDQANLNGDTHYNVMFGPDVCGSTRRVHFILNHGDDNHLIKREVAPKMEMGRTHVYTAVIKADQTYQLMIDGEVMQEGSLTDDWELLPPREIPDPDASKPADWVDERMIADPEDIKPAGWDDVPAEIVDEAAEKPEDWDDDMDGEWEPPMIPNPEYQGEWQPKMINNPDYKGEWIHPTIPNPDFAEDPNLHVYDIGSVAIEVWQVESGTIFDNILITDDLAEAEAFVNGHFAELVEHERAELAAEAAAISEAAAAAAAEEIAAENDDDDIDEEDDDDKDEL